MWYWFSTLLALNVFDVAATHHEITKQGMAIEGNPVMRTAFSLYGFLPVILLKAVMFVLLVALLIHYGRTHWTIKVATGIFGVLFFWHLLVLEHV